jgi:hypothetical protein
MRSTFAKLVFGCGLAAALSAPAFACEFYKQTVKTDDTVVQSQQATPDAAQTVTPDTPQTAESQPSPNAGSN